ncbi:MAG: hypothetical protein ABW075_09830 [Aeromicrobium sp.]
MSFVIVLAVILAFAGSVGAALFISIDRAASLDHDPTVGRFAARK